MPPQRTLGRLLAFCLDLPPKIRSQVGPRSKCRRTKRSVVHLLPFIYIFFYMYTSYIYIYIFFKSMNTNEHRGRILPGGAGPLAGWLMVCETPTFRASASIRRAVAVRFDRSLTCIFRRRQPSPSVRTIDKTMSDGQGFRLTKGTAPRGSGTTPTTRVAATQVAAAPLG